MVESKKQGLIQGAKMMIEGLKVNIFSEEEQKSNNVWYKKGWNDNAVKTNNQLKQLNNWLEKE